MTITADDVAGLLVRAWPGVTPGVAVPLSGGFWASMFRVPVTGQPDGVAPEVVVRLAPHRLMGAKEAEVQKAVATQGFPTPPVWLSAPDETRDGWWSVMDFAPGAALLADLDATTAVRRAPSLVRTLPARLAEVMADLHRLDPEPVSAAVEAVAPDAAWSPSAVLAQLRLGAKAAARSDLVTALDELGRRQPECGRDVVCHGDLHPFNVLDRGGELVVLDWTGAVVADPCFDVALTELLLANPPLVLPRPLDVVKRAAGRLLARRFLTAYTDANPEVSLAPLEWFRALHSARVLVEVTSLRAARGPDADGHPWVLVAPAAAANLTAATGVEVRS